MGKRARSALALACSSALLGCATTPVPTDQATPAPADRVMDRRIVRATPEDAVLVLKRDAGSIGFGCTHRFFVNGQPAADLWPSERAIFYVAPGQYIISAQPNGICAGGMSEVQVQLTPRSIRTLRTGYGTNGEFALHVTAF